VKPDASGDEMVDRVWLDREHGWAPRRRETRRKDGTLVSRVTYSNLKEIVPGLWLPQDCRTEFGAPPSAPAEHRGKPYFAYRIKVITWSVDKIDDELFEIPEGEPTLDAPGARRK
jgi:hypothetical protein